jgi:hypothetical protein
MATARTAETRRLASPTIKALIRQRSAALTGLVLGMLGLALLVALVCYDPRDPSLNTATSRHTGNLAGPVGAVIADLLLQGFGLAGALPGLAMLAWAWRIASLRGLGSMAARLSALLAALPVLAAVLAAIPAPRTLVWPTVALTSDHGPVGWPRRTGAGGRGDDVDDGVGARRHPDASGVGPNGQRVARRRSHCPACHTFGHGIPIACAPFLRPATLAAFPTRRRCPWWRTPRGLPRNRAGRVRKACRSRLAGAFRRCRC